MILKSWLPKHKNARLTVVDPGQRPDLWKKYKIRAVPTMVFIDGVSKREVVFEGAKSEKELGEYVKALFAPKAKSEGERK